jgi:hypothetical protein
VGDVIKGEGAVLPQDVQMCQEEADHEQTATGLQLRIGPTSHHQGGGHDDEADELWG